MNIKLFRFSSLLFAYALVAASFCFDLPAVAGNALAQNSNSATTTMTGNSNTGTTRKTQGRRKKQPATPTTTEGTAEPVTEVTPATAPVEATTQTDLSGTYAGTFDCSDASMTGDTTLTITGNQFTTADGKSGRITAATTRGYTGVAMQFGELTPSTNGQPGVAPVIVSMRAKKSGSRLTLTSVPGAMHACSFMPAGSRVARTRRARTKATTASEAVPTAEPVAAPVTPAEPVTTPTAPVEPVSPATPVPEAGPMPPAAPKPARRGRRGRSTSPNTSPTTNTSPGPESAKPKPTPTP